MAVNGTLGSKLFISDAAIASTVDSEPAFFAQDWTEIGLIESFGAFGRKFALATFQAIRDGRTYKLKAGYDDGSFQFTVGQDLTDAGQAAFQDAADDADQDNYGFRVEFNDPESSVGGPTTYFWRGLPMEFSTQMGAANAVIKASCTVEVNSDIIYVPPADLYDRFVTGGSLAAYTLYKGSDAQALDPVISTDTLSMVTGDAGTGYAADGSEIVGDTGHTLAGGTLTVVEARIKLSAITNVAMFFGLTDNKGSLEAAIESAASADTITTNATDAVGFMFDTSMATDNIWLVGVNNDTDDTAQNAGSAFAVATYVTLRIEIDGSGNADFYLDGASVGTQMATACRTGVSLYPVIIAAARSTASRTVTVDYLSLRQD